MKQNSSKSELLSRSVTERNDTRECDKVLTNKISSFQTVGCLVWTAVRKDTPSHSAHADIAGLQEP